MVNTREASLNVVTKHKPKMLLKNGSVVSAFWRLQKEAWAKRHVVRFWGSELPRRRCRTTGEETRPKPPEVFHLRNVVSPLFSCGTHRKGSREAT